MAAPTLGTAQTAVASTSASSVSASITPPVGTTCLLLLVALDDSGSGVPSLTSPTFGGSPVTQYATVVRSTFNRIYAYYVFNPATSAQTFSATKDRNGFWIVMAIPVFGSETSSEAAAFGAVATGAGVGGTSPSTTVTSATGELVIDAVTHAQQDTESATVGAGQTLVASANTINTGAASLRSYSSSEAGGASVVMSWTKSGATAGWAQLAFSLKGTATIGGKVGGVIRVCTREAVNRASRW